MPRPFARFGEITYNENLGTNSEPSRVVTAYPEYGTPKLDDSFDTGDGWYSPALPITWSHASDTKHDDSFDTGGGWYVPAVPISWSYGSNLQFDDSFDTGGGWYVPAVPISWTYATHKQLDESYVIIAEGGDYPSGSLIPE